MKITIFLLSELQVILIFIGKIIFKKNPLSFRIYADFEADNEIDTSVIGNKTTNIYKQNPACNGYNVVS